MWIFRDQAHKIKKEIPPPFSIGQQSREFARRGVNDGRRGGNDKTCCKKFEKGNRES